MSSKEIKNLLEYWLEASRKDLESSRQITEKTSSYVNALFLMHLALEKLLKAYFVFEFEDHAPFTHNLVFLASKLSIPFNEAQKQFLSKVNEYNLECRYPDAKFAVYKKANKIYTVNQLKNVEALWDWIYKKLDTKRSN